MATDTKRTAKARTPKASKTDTAPKNIYTTNDLAQHFGWNAKALRRRMRAKGINIGKGNRHAFTKADYDRVVTQLTK